MLDPQGGAVKGIADDVDTPATVEMRTSTGVRKVFKTSRARQNFRFRFRTPRSG